MATFNYIALDAQGQQTTGTVQASDEADAIQNLRGQLPGSVHARKVRIFKNANSVLGQSSTVAVVHFRAPSLNIWPYIRQGYGKNQMKSANKGILGKKAAA